jgi:hypothetical protein
LPASHICIGKRKDKRKDQNNKINIHTRVFGVWVLLTVTFVSFGVWTLEFVMGFSAEAISYKKICPSGQDKNNKETLKLIFYMPICLLHCC